MAIIRCPYCHAIIDEADKYCNNCGTQLLFAEDDELEEEIPGEKIIEAEVEEKDYTVVEPEEEKRRKRAKDLDSEIDKELAGGTEPEAGEPGLDELVEEEEREADEVTEEVILVDEIEAAEKAGTKGSEELGPAAEKGPDTERGPAEGRDDEDIEEDAARDSPEGEEDDEEDEDEDEDEEAEEEEDEAAEGVKAADVEEDEERREVVEKEEREEDEEETQEFTAAPPKEPSAVREPAAPPADESEPEVEYVVEPAPPDDASTAGEAAFRAATFDTKELENLGRTVELSKAKVDELLENLSGRRPPTPPPAPTPEPPPPQAAPPRPAPAPPEPAPSPEPEETAPGAMPPTPTGSLPPWASTMKGAPVFAEVGGPAEKRKSRRGAPGADEAEEEVEIFPRKRGADSTIGLPEKISQSPLPFEEPAAEPDEEELADALAEAGTGEEEAEAAEELGSREVTPEEAVRPGGEAKPVRESILPVRGPAAGREREAISSEEDEEPEEPAPFSFSVFLKSKAFDVLFVGLFWLVALWLAAASLGVTLFAILASMSGPMLLLYAVFLVIYIFLFKFFLGETLGDRLFKPRE